MKKVISEEKLRNMLRQLLENEYKSNYTDIVQSFKTRSGFDDDNFFQTFYGVERSGAQLGLSLLTSLTKDLLEAKDSENLISNETLRAEARQSFRVSEKEDLKFSYGRTHVTTQKDLNGLSFVGPIKYKRKSKNKMSGADGSYNAERTCGIVEFDDGFKWVEITVTRDDIERYATRYPDRHHNIFSDLGRVLEFDEVIRYINAQFKDNKNSFDYIILKFLTSFMYKEAYTDSDLQLILNHSNKIFQEQVASTSKNYKFYVALGFLIAYPKIKQQSDEAAQRFFDDILKDVEEAEAKAAAEKEKELAKEERKKEAKKGVDGLIGVFVTDVDPKWEKVVNSVDRALIEEAYIEDPTFTEALLQPPDRKWADIGPDNMGKTATLDMLDPFSKDSFTKFINELVDLGYFVGLNSIYRSEEDQENTQKNTKGAVADYSWHTLGCAVDIQVVRYTSDYTINMGKFSLQVNARQETNIYTLAKKEVDKSKEVSDPKNYSPEGEPLGDIEIPEFTKDEQEIIDQRIPLYSKSYKNGNGSSTVPFTYTGLNNVFHKLWYQLSLAQTSFFSSTGLTSKIDWAGGYKQGNSDGVHYDVCYSPNGWENDAMWTNVKETMEYIAGEELISKILKPASSNKAYKQTARGFIFLANYLFNLENEKLTTVYNFLMGDSKNNDGKTIDDFKVVKNKETGEKYDMSIKEIVEFSVIREYGNEQQLTAQKSKFKSEDKNIKENKIIISETQLREIMLTLISQQNKNKLVNENFRNKINKIKRYLQDKILDRQRRGRREVNVEFSEPEEEAQIKSIVAKMDPDVEGANLSKQQIKIINLNLPKNIEPIKIDDKDEESFISTDLEKLNQAKAWMLKEISFGLVNLEQVTATELLTLSGDLFKKWINVEWVNT